MALGLVAGLVGGVAKKLGGKAVRWATKQAFGSKAQSAVTGAVAGQVVPAVTRRITQGLTGGGSMPRLPITQRIDLNPFGPNVDRGMFGFGAPVKRRYRRMNYLNQRALKKSIKRVQGFEKIVREAFTVSKGSLTLKKRRCS